MSNRQMTADQREFFLSLPAAEVIGFYTNPEILDLSRGPVNLANPTAGDQEGCVAIGRYNEKRPGSYTEVQFGSGSTTRNIHIGVDLIAKVGTSVFALTDGTVFSAVDLNQPQDYGPAISIRHEWRGRVFWSFYGHLQRLSLLHLKIGEKVEKGQIIGWVGDETENGGWWPHLHFQLSLVPPIGGDLPGVVAMDQLKQALLDYPNPGWVMRSEQFPAELII